jgi:ABC-2 type transport system ATP-binding protein
MLAQVGLQDARDKLVRQYSGGMIRRLEIAQAALHRPRVLFLDEPTVGLDPIARRSVWEMIEQFRAKKSVTVFMTTHLMDEADRLCDRVAIMHHGRIVAIGEPAALKAEIGDEKATLEDVFIRHTGDTLDEGGSYRDTARIRRTANRLG